MTASYKSWRGPNTRGPHTISKVGEDASHVSHMVAPMLLVGQTGRGVDGYAGRLPEVREEGRQQLHHHSDPSIQPQSGVRPDCRTRREPE